jgi:uncharacterized membrane protein YraQ (UPF0718 family)
VSFPIVLRGARLPVLLHGTPFQITAAAAVGLGLWGFLRANPDSLAGLSTFSTRFLGIFIEAAPFLLLGTLTSGLIEVFVNRNHITRLVPRNPLLSAGFGVLLGFALPVCECGVVPVTRRLFAKGLPVSVGVTFVLASPVMNPIVLASTWSAFGVGPVLIGRYVITAIVAGAIGLIFAAGGRPRDILRATSMVTISGGAVASPSRDITVPADAEATPGPIMLLPRLRAALSLASDEFVDMGRYLIIGSALAATMQTVVSQDVLLSLGRGPVSSVITMQVLAYVLSVCSTVDAFLALAFRGAFTTASILTFLTFGPMVDMKSTMMFLGVFRPKMVVYLVALPLLMTMAIGIWLNLNVAL